ncbi:hypothetical protein T190_08440 [Sinorhizobium meliloti CCBAU 01290]|nr:hypothetical protein T190_08440 [Sinorhizobium meliloti CCBAU 01290]
MKLGQVMALFRSPMTTSGRSRFGHDLALTNQDAYYTHRMITETAVRASDRRVVYVGIDAYEAAGGRDARPIRAG